ncbi:MAG: DUF1727 domain-containing protein [Oscillospiraceae bacterium]|nr:DUF1727 domain-containing protein [Oscillospiraceae bacterium]
MKYAIASLACKILTFAGKILGGGTDLPGKIALKLYPDAMKKLKFTGKVISVTGSNGKTTTSNLISHIIRENGYSVVNNELGSNMKSGIASLLISKASLSGRVKADYVVLETDERYARHIFKDIKIDYFMVLNLLRDQVARNGNPDVVLAAIKEAVDMQPDMHLILNANEPISMSLQIPGRTSYFAMDRTERSTDECVSGTHDCKICPKCFHPMEYDYYHYNHLGKFHCSHCDYGTPEADFTGTNADFENKHITVNGTVLDVPFDTTFNMFNTVAVCAACQCAGITMGEIIKPLSTFKGAKGRRESFTFEGRPVNLMMTKQNAASLDQSLSFVLEQKGEKTILLFVNNVLYLDYKDISWLYDVAFGRVKGKVKNIVCSGNRALDTAIRLKAAGIDEDIMIYENDITKVKDALRRTEGDIYILAASAFGDEGKIIEEMKK